ncbi:glutathione S-transferase family protein [Pseudomonadales bacterium]|nr:glutathione S-transferase family protein [Pseudomonadales bacterium]MDA8951048.1 glutathione S-transferase family protein [Pseudomonadales bacterium]
MHLYTMSASPNGKRVAIFMKEKGIDIPTTEIDLRAGENLTDEYRRKNPFGRVPVLELDDGTFLSESQAICLYLEGLYLAPNLFGESADERAKIEMWARRVDLNFLMPVAQGFRNLTGYYKDRETCVKEWGEVSTLAARDTAVLLDAHLANNQFLLGDRYAIPDMTLAIVMGFAKNVDQDFFDLPNLSRFYAVVTARAAFQ